MRKSHIPPLATALSLALSPLLTADTVTVPDPAAGILTVQDGLDAADNGDTVLIQPGEYRGNFSIEGKLNVTVKGKGTVILDARPQGATPSGPALTVTTCPGLTLDRITMRNAAGDAAQGAGLRVSASELVVLKRLTVVGCQTNGILLEQCDFATVVDCELRGNAGGISISGELCEVKRVVVSNDASFGVQVFGDDASVLDSVVAVVRGGGGIVISGDRPVVRKCDVSAVLDVDSNGITTSGFEPELRDNRVRGCDTGIYVVYGAYGVVQDNVVEQCSAAGLRLGVVSHHLTLEKNVVRDCGGAGVPGFWVDGEAQTLIANRIEGCADDGILVESASCVLQANKVLRNCKDGIDIAVTASATLLEDNVAKDNGAEGIDNSGTDTRLRDNRAKRNRTDFASDGTVIDEGGNDFDVMTAPPPEID